MRTLVKSPLKGQDGVMDHCYKRAAATLTHASCPLVLVSSDSRHNALSTPQTPFLRHSQNITNISLSIFFHHCHPSRNGRCEATLPGRQRWQTEPLGTSGPHNRLPRRDVRRSTTRRAHTRPAGHQTGAHRRQAPCASHGRPYIFLQCPTGGRDAGNWLKMAYDEMLEKHHLHRDELRLAVIHDDPEGMFGALSFVPWGRSDRREKAARVDRAPAGTDGP
ncbi:hypothetical protein GE09DRAFT_698136 [Coniochaeta sp. 2T2.1]|nr:hypothetical protein GE09DRAFT_698136 [Coniochaeta sp. 2T2.1]